MTTTPKSNPQTKKDLVTELAQYILVPELDLESLEKLTKPALEELVTKVKSYQ